MTGDRDVAEALLAAIKAATVESKTMHCHASVKDAIAKAEAAIKARWGWTAEEQSKLSSGGWVSLTDDDGA